jgi:hypothetical protein
VSANGYHSLPGISFKHHKLYQGAQDRFLTAFLDDRRNEELTILRELAPHVKSSPGKTWMFSVVAKQDLWWPEHSEVNKWYSEGLYATEINAIQNQFGQRQFRHELAFVSLVISNYVSGKNELLKPNVEGYDHLLQVESLRRVFEIVAALKEWEETK